MNEISQVTNYPVAVASNENKIRFKAQETALPDISYDSFIKAREKEVKKAKRKQDIMTGLQAGALVAIILTVPLMIKSMKGTQFEKSTKELTHMWSDLTKASKIDDLALPTSLKNFTTKFKNSVSNPEVLKQRGGRPAKSVLLYGPPGTGKTTFAKALAKDFPDAKFAELDVTNLGSEYQNVSERNIKNAIELICKEADSNPDKKFFVFIDEIDSVMMVDNSLSAHQTNKVLNEFKKGFTEKLGKRNNIITIGATNLPIDIEKGITMGGKKLDRPMLDRFSQKVLVDLPTKDQIANTIKYHYKDSSLVSETLKTDTPELNRISEFLSKPEHNTSFRTLEALYDSSASRIEGTEKKVEVKDFVKSILEKQNELNFSNSDFDKLLADLKINPVEIL